MVTLQEFKNADLKVGRILSVEDHPNADKLVIFRVDVGEPTPRTLVAGLKPYYKADELVGRLVVVVANLEPALLRGVESRGMLLAAQEGNTVSLLTLDREVAPGSPVV